MKFLVKWFYVGKTGKYHLFIYKFGKVTISTKWYKWHSTQQPRLKGWVKSVEPKVCILAMMGPFSIWYDWHLVFFFAPRAFLLFFFLSFVFSCRDLLPLIGPLLFFLHFILFPPPWLGLSSFYVLSCRDFRARNTIWPSS